MNDKWPPENVNEHGDFLGWVCTEMPKNREGAEYEPCGDDCPFLDRESRCRFAKFTGENQCIQ